MRFAAVVVLVICFLAVALAIPAKMQKKPSCSRDCGTTFDPICAKAKNSTKERLLTFGSECVMANYNCEHSDDPFEIKSKSECGGNVSVRLS